MGLVNDIYLKKTNLRRRELEKLLVTDIWLNATTALQYGLVDEII